MAPPMEDIGQRRERQHDSEENMAQHAPRARVAIGFCLASGGAWRIGAASATRMSRLDSFC
jgi:hypothetical protein